VQLIILTGSRKLHHFSAHQMNNKQYICWLEQLVESADDVRASVEVMEPAGPGCVLLLVLLGDVAALLSGLRGCS
jgi:hypothetical protein